MSQTNEPVTEKIYIDRITAIVPEDFPDGTVTEQVHINPLKAFSEEEEDPCAWLLGAPAAAGGGK
jgi:hypothetical protein